MLEPVGSTEVHIIFLPAAKEFTDYWGRRGIYLSNSSRAWKVIRGMRPKEICR